MRRYLYILLCISLFVFVGCKRETPTPNKEHVIAFHIGDVNVEVSENDATITLEKPFVTIDGLKIEGTSFCLEFWEADDSENIIYLNDYVEDNGIVTFVAKPLFSGTTYNANIVLYGGETIGPERKAFTFTTLDHNPVFDAECNAKVEARGIVATIKLSNMKYTMDLVNDIPISKIYVEYASMDSEEWVAKEFSSNSIIKNELKAKLPFNGADYLTENSSYKYRVTLVPTGGHEPLMIDSLFSFDTTYAEVRANIAKPTLKADGDGIHVSSQNIEIFLDDVNIADTQLANSAKYYFSYRMKGAADWLTTEVEMQEGGLSMMVPATELKADTTYEFETSIMAGAAETVCKSEISEIKTDPYIAPKPPVEGGGDTSLIAGTWHLTEWRGATPDFDVYMSISEDGIVGLWQRIERRIWECYYSVAVIAEQTIYGEYTDGTAWGASYSFTIDGDTMTWTDTADATDISVYTRSELPDDINVEQPTATRSGAERFL